MRPTRIFYLYFHDTRFVPIHAAEVIGAMARQGMQVDVFTFLARSALTRTPFPPSVRVHSIWTPTVRFISEPAFLVLAFPVVLFWALIRRPHAFYARHSAVSVLAATVARLLRRPCLVEINDIQADKLQYASASGPKLLWVRTYDRLAFRAAHHLLPVTPEIAAWLVDTCRVPARKVRVTPNGVNPERFSPKPRDDARRRYDVPPNVPVLLSLGSLFPWAGIETLLDAAARLRNSFPEAVTVIGSGEEPYLSKVRTHAHRLGLADRVRFFGFIPWDDAAWFISMASLCISPIELKQTRSGLSSLRTLSYLSCGRAVVASDVPGLGDMLVREGIGFSFPMRDASALAGTIGNALADPDRLERMGFRAREFVVRSRSWDAIARNIQALVATGKD